MGQRSATATARQLMDCLYLHRLASPRLAVTRGWSCGDPGFFWRFGKRWDDPADLQQ